MKIISISLNQKNVDEIGGIQKEWGLSSFSEAIRASVRETKKTIEEESKISGKIFALLIVRHSHETEKFLSTLKHEFQKVIQSQSHNCIFDDQCLDVFLVKGDAEKIKKFKNSVVGNNKIQKVKLVVL
ncbi:MAG: CopG family ribbon-helix-helix protein [Candidatus Diapherotrites archaeon]|nr:CopG family ribbon-helix-helix protein [Candidatus Diapherotrites archaeon]